MVVKRQPVPTLASITEDLPRASPVLAVDTQQRRFLLS